MNLLGRRHVYSLIDAWCAIMLAMSLPLGVLSRWGIFDTGAVSFFHLNHNSPAQGKQAFKRKRVTLTLKGFLREKRVKLLESVIMLFGTI